MGFGAAGEWPENGLDVAGLAAFGWRPVPFREFVLKISSRCDLACAHCYVYEAADQSWRSQPVRMETGTLRRTAARIARHVERHRLPEVDVVLHGGEPLLAGAEFIDFALREIRSVVPCAVRVGVQTNGTLLTEQTLALLAAHDVGVSVSVDGDRAGHDRRRRYADGRGSHAAVTRGLDRLAGDFRHLYRGLVCTVDLANDPVAVYEALLESRPPRVNFLLPHGTWSVPPPGLDPGGPGAPYADWLIAVFDRWYGSAVRETGVRLFEEIMNLVLGGQSRSESVGLSPVALVVVDTDGSIQQVDTLKSAFAGAPRTGFTVDRHDFDDVLGHPGVVARQIGRSALCAECSGCRVRHICGGGNYTHRYRAGRGFRNPSVYCRDLMKTIDHVAGRMRADLLPAGAVVRG
ncbi:FxsB family radical SAM/SPASM domain protein [Actinomadura syzygii]|uniref:FxsB family radical SAM/SPASM domain protein n=1 Tax=Actinomadura syzygii TaxID=1427538 RepID=A0A5D0UIW2_9ACTN|nr:FxsB family radical SAM/SPASM domain protein [Actinomadura syzygii]